MVETAEWGQCWVENLNIHCLQPPPSPHCIQQPPTSILTGPLFTLKESAMWRKVLSPFPTPAWVAHGWLMGGSPKRVGFPHGHQGPISASAPLSSLLTGLCLHLVPYFLISTICLFTNLFNTNNTYQHVSQCFKGAMEISSLNQNTLRWKLSSLFFFFL